jgi:hypothetical protein
VTSSAKRPRAAIEAAATNPAIAAIRSATTMETSAAAMKTASATVKTAAASTMETAAAAAVTAAAVLSKRWIWRECKTDESSKCDERSAKTECAHNQYLFSNLGAHFRESSQLWKGRRST